MLEGGGSIQSYGASYVEWKWQSAIETTLGESSMNWAGIVDVDHRPRTLRELPWMGEARAREVWACKSLILALIANVTAMRTSGAPAR